MTQYVRAQPSNVQQALTIMSFELVRFLKDRKTLTIPVVSLIPLIFIAFGPKIELDAVNSTFKSVLETFGMGIIIISGLLFANEVIVTESENKTLSLWIIQPIKRETLFLSRGFVLAMVLMLEGVIFSFASWFLIAFKADLLSPANNNGEAFLSFSEGLFKVWFWYLLVVIFYAYFFVLLALITPNNFLLIGLLVGFGEPLFLGAATTLSPFLHFVNILAILVNQTSAFRIPIEMSVGYILLLTAIEVIFLLFYVSQKNFH